MNIYEIAAEAGVSISTVSRVLNAPEKVAPATRQRVQEILEKNYYVPNAMARGLAQNSMKNIGILTSDIRFIHFSTATHFLEDALFNLGYSTLLCLANHTHTKNKDKKEQYIRILSEKKVDGLVLVGSVFSTPDVHQMMLDYLPNIPTVIINGSLPGSNIYTVSLDQQHGMQLLLDHLAERGYENIYFVQATQSQNTTRKVSAFVDIMKKKGFSTNKQNNVVLCDYNYESIAAFAKEFLPNVGQRTAVIFHDELMAAYGYNSFSQLGCSVPGDVAIVGYDNTHLALIPNPQLTTLDTKIEILSNLAANLLHDVLTQKASSHGIAVLPELVIRSST